MAEITIEINSSPVVQNASGNWDNTTDPHFKDPNTPGYDKTKDDMGGATLKDSNFSKSDRNYSWTGFPAGSVVGNATKTKVTDIHLQTTDGSTIKKDPTSGGKAFPTVKYDANGQGVTFEAKDANGQDSGGVDPGHAFWIRTPKGKYKGRATPTDNRFAMLWEPQPPLFVASVSAPVHLHYAHRERALSFTVSPVDATAALNEAAASKLMRLLGSRIALGPARLTATENGIHNFHPDAARMLTAGSPDWEMAMSDYQVCVDPTTAPATFLQGFVAYSESNAARDAHPLFDSPPPHQGRGSLVLQVRSDLSAASGGFARDATSQARLWLAVVHVRAPLCPDE